MKILRIFGVLVLCLFAFYDGAVGAYFNKYALNSNSGNLNPGYVDILCAYVDNNVAKWYKHRANESNQNCPSDPSVYTINNQDLSLSGLDIPQKEACDSNNANCEPERFLSYNPNWASPRMPATSDTQTVWTIYNRDFPAASTSYFNMHARWAPISGKTKVNLTYVPGEGSYYSNPNDGATGNVVNTCVYDDTTSAGCQILPADTFVAPPGKYFDGWFCDSNISTDSTNCKIPRYLPNNWQNLGIEPVSTTLSNISRYKDYIDNEIPQTMATAYTGSNNLTLTASWAPHNITFTCNTQSNQPFAPINAQNQSVTINQYTTNTGQTKDIVFGSTIKLSQNLDRLPKCKSPYNKYDEDRGNDKWCEKFFTSPKNSGFSLYRSYREIADIENLDYTNNGTIQMLFGQDGVSIPIFQTCATPSISYSCGNFSEAVYSLVDGIAPERYWAEYYDSATQRYILRAAYYHTSHYVSDRNRPLPAKPYPDGGISCSTTTLPHTGYEFLQVTTGSNTTMGNGCCIPTEYGNTGDADTGQRKHAVFKGWKATGTRNGVASVLTHNGWQPESGNPEPRLLQPNEYGYGSIPNVDPRCNLTINQNTFTDEAAIDAWNPGDGCNLWPWSTNVTFTAVWDYAPILVTLDGNSILPNIYLDYDVGFFTEDTFENSITHLTQEQIVIPEHAIFGGYYWCPGNGGDTVDDCENPEQIIDANGDIIQGKKNFTKVDAILWPQWTCEPNYHEDNGACEPDEYTINYLCNNGTSASQQDTATFGQDYTVKSLEWSGCTNEYATFTGWTFSADGETYAGDGTAHINPWSHTTGELNFVAQWEGDTYNLIFDCEAGPYGNLFQNPEGGPRIRQIQYGGNINLLSGCDLRSGIDPAHCIYDDHWFRNPSIYWAYVVPNTSPAHTIYAPVGLRFDMIYHDDVTFYPNIVTSTYKIIYSCGMAGGTPPDTAQVVYTNCDMVNLATPDNCVPGEGMRFVGWRIYGETRILQPGLQDFVWPAVNNLPLTAQWECQPGMQLNAYGTGCIPCGADQHVVNGVCEDNVIECNAANATAAIRTWNTTINAYSSCQIQECNDGYHIESNACVLNVQVCNLDNGRGAMLWDTDTETWGQCAPMECDPGYEYVNGECAECENKYDANNEIAVSSYILGCQIAACMYQGEKYALDGDICRPICEDDSDYTGTRHWNERTHKCERTCNPGYLMW